MGASAKMHVPRNRPHSPPGLPEQKKYSRVCSMAAEAKRRVGPEKAGIGNLEQSRMHRLTRKVPFRLDWERF